MLVPIPPATKRQARRIDEKAYLFVIIGLRKAVSTYF